VAGTLEVLKLLSLTDCVVTADALHCHVAVAQGSLAREVEYVLTLEENQSASFADAQTILEPVGDQIQAAAKNGARAYFRPQL
jgi:predicted transposase YbfD/YdcC